MTGPGWRSGLPEAAAAFLLCLLTLSFFWPGVALYDSVNQYQQALTGAYDDWHPPVMARLWALLLHVRHGTEPMFVLQLVLFWLGVGLLASACARRGLRWTAWIVLLIGAVAFLSCWMAAVLKDSQMMGALAAAVGLGACYRLEERRLPPWAGVAVLILLLYALLVRANSVFAVVPLALALFGWPRLRTIWTRALVAVLLVLLVIALEPAINRGLFGAERSGVENSLLAYDIDGTAIRAGAGDVAGISAGTWAQLKAKGCYSAASWDPFDAPACTPNARIAAEPDTPPLYGLWLKTILHHPLAYAAHRIAHFNSTMRLVVPANLPGAMSPVDPEPNTLGLGRTPSDAEWSFADIGAAWSALPPAWPCFWLALAIVALWPAAQAPRGPERDLALALLLSAVCGGLSYGVVSVASDLRYHLWTMLASAIGIILLAGAGAIRRRHLIALTAVACVVIVAGVAGRLLLTPLPVPPP